MSKCLLEEASAGFQFEGTLVSTEPYGNGHINDTFLLKFADEDGNTIKKCHAVEGDQGLQDYADALADYDDLTILCNSIILKISISTLLIGAIVF